MAPQLAPPGSSSYTSNTLKVGDGTWDATRNTFLLPNLVGLNFATTRYNGNCSLLQLLLCYIFFLITFASFLLCVYMEASG
jgi:hypothetical protein